ncbi:MAG: EamA family transporter, partial [Nitrospinota bacterium]|nr:EamA family transporter [Nitrospinota bacterium]
MNKGTESHFMLGIFLSIVTALLWGILPIILKVSLQGFTTGTIACFRFASAFFILGVFLSFQGHRPLNILKKPPWMGIFGGV